MSKTHRVTSKGQVTIPVEMREALGIRPGSAVRFELEGNALRLVLAPEGDGHGKELVRRMRGRATARLSTDEIMALTRA